MVRAADLASCHIVAAAIVACPAALDVVAVVVDIAVAVAAAAAEERPKTDKKNRAGSE